MNFPKLNSLPVMENLIKVKAESKFQEAVAGIFTHVTPQQLELMAQQGVTLEGVITAMKVKVPRASDPAARAGVQYLVSRTDQYLLGLVTKVAPDHAEVFTRYPQYTRSFLADLRGLALAATS